MNEAAGSGFRPLEVERLRALDGAPLASFPSRAGAFVVDLLLVLAVYVAVGLPSALAHREREGGGPLVVHWEPFHSALGLVALVLYFGVLTWLMKGQTPAKRLFHIRVVSVAHEHLGLWHSIERALGYGASALEGGFGFVQYFIHPNRRTVHDRIAETIVVRVPRRNEGPARASVPARPSP